MRRFQQLMCLLTSCMTGPCERNNLLHVSLGAKQSCRKYAGQAASRQQLKAADACNRLSSILHRVYKCHADWFPGLSAGLQQRDYCWHLFNCPLAHLRSWGKQVSATPITTTPPLLVMLPALPSAHPQFACTWPNVPTSDHTGNICQTRSRPAL